MRAAHSLMPPDWLRSHFRLSPAQWQRYAPCFTRLEVPARTVLLREGEVARRVFAIERGCLRVWFNSQGREITLQFFFEHHTVSSIESFRQHAPSLFCLETIEPCVLWFIDRAAVLQLLAELAEDPTGREHIAHLLLDRLRHHTAHYVSFVRDSPRERYQQLLAHQPQVVQRVPQHYIASYLGITPVHLSRIKREK